MLDSSILMNMNGNAYHDCWVVFLLSEKIDLSQARTSSFKKDKIRSNTFFISAVLPRLMKISFLHHWLSLRIARSFSKSSGIESLEIELLHLSSDLMVDASTSCRSENENKGESKFFSLSLSLNIFACFSLLIDFQCLSIEENELIKSVSSDNEDQQ